MAAAIAHGDSNRLVARISNVLGHGAAAAGSGATNRELQQEMVHFSRIVDLGWLGEVPADKRLRRSTRLHSRLKFLVELFLASRSRTEMDIGRTRTKTLSATEGEAASVYFLAARQDDQTFLFSFSTDTRRQQRHLAFITRLLLDYLSPIEALYATAYYCRVVLNSFSTTITLDTPTEGKFSQRTSLDPVVDPAGAEARGLQSWLVANLPTSKPSGSEGVAIFPDRVEIAYEDDTVVLTLPRATEVGPIAFPAQLVPALSDRLKRVCSLECGHIHLDRLLDEDQRLGIRLGAEIVDEFARVGARVPVLPLLDDDHVSCVLRPTEVLSLFMSVRPSLVVSMIPESSPIVRMITVALYRRVIASSHPGRVKRLGDNLYFRVTPRSYVELFEDVDGICATGCIFFEVALLIYRTAPAIFEGIFETYFNTHGIHSAILDILSGPDEPDAKTIALSELYSRWRMVTSVVEADDELVGKAFAAVEVAVGRMPIHINVLESYYSSQQDKVREFMDALGLPINLISVYFDSRSGTVSMSSLGA